MYHDYRPPFYYYYLSYFLFSLSFSLSLSTIIQDIFSDLVVIDSEEKKQVLLDYEEEHLFGLRLDEVMTAYSLQF